ncbi:MAG: DUF6142 family protein [Lachnospiraceae bacterium]|nr:DUF6142 family protein [Lachnospiraceae bacterium]
MGVLSKYKFTNKKHPLKAVMSVGLALIGSAAVLMTVYSGYRAGGEVAWGHVVAVALAVLMAVTGLVLGIMSRVEKDRYYFFPILGIVLNFVLLATIVFFMVRGMSI